MSFSDFSEPAPVLSGTTEFDRVPQKKRDFSKLSPQQLSDKFSLNLVAQHIFDTFTKCTDSTGSCCQEQKSSSDASKDTCGCKPNASATGKPPSVALQMPDRLIPDAAYISQVLSFNLEKVYSNSTDIKPPRLYVLGDTSYSPCCVDVVAAQHVSAKTIVHFGTACLNNVRDVNVIYVFGKEQVAFSLELLAEKIKDTYSNDDNEEIEQVVFMYDPEYEFQLQDFVSSRFSNNTKYKVLDSHIVRPTDSSVIIPEINEQTSPVAQAQAQDDETTQLSIPGRQVLTTTPISSESFLENGSIFYVTHGAPSPSVLLHLKTLARNIYIIDGSNQQASVDTPNMSLQYRYRSMSTARMAATIGILVNTLSFRDVTVAISQIQNWITNAGKKYYTFVVGKPNVPKLANFDVIDVWVILGCSKGGIIMGENGGQDLDYHKPIITPYELKLAVQSQPTWTGKWYIEFENVLNNMKNLGLPDEDEEEEENEEDHTSEGESEKPVFDPVTGTLVSTSRPLHTRRITHLDVKQDNDDDKKARVEGGEDSKSGLVVRHSSHLVIRNTVSTAADHLYNKLTWTGLGSDFKEIDEDSEGENENGEKKEKRFATVEQGRGGVARSYGIVGDDTPRK